MWSYWHLVSFQRGSNTLYRGLHSKPIFRLGENTHPSIFYFSARADAMCMYMYDRALKFFSRSSIERHISIANDRSGLTGLNRIPCMFPDVIKYHSVLIWYMNSISSYWAHTWVPVAHTFSPSSRCLFNLPTIANWTSNPLQLNFARCSVSVRSKTLGEYRGYVRSRFIQNSVLRKR